MRWWNVRTDGGCRRKRIRSEVLESHTSRRVLSVLGRLASIRSLEQLTVHIDGCSEARHVVGAVFNGGVLRQLPAPALAKLLQFAFVHFGWGWRDELGGFCSVGLWMNWGYLRFLLNSVKMVLNSVVKL